MQLLEVEHLYKYFPTSGGALHAVDDVSFTLDKDRTLGVIGESGCGKSTLGRAILRLHDPNAGKVLFEGRNILDLSKKEMGKMRMQMQMIFQDPYASLNPRMSISQIIAEPFQIFPELEPDKSKITDRVLELMDVAGLSRRLANSYPHELDGGRRQRIGIARALAVNPKFIVCDEPVSALDVSIQAQVLNLLQDLQVQNGLAYMFITHDLSVVKHISNEIMVMYLGQVVEKAPTKDLFSETLHPYTQALLSAIPRPSIHQKREKIILQGEVSNPIDPKPGCRFAKRCPYATEKCKTTDPVLTEYKPQHFVACHRVAKQMNTSERSTV